MSEPPLRRQFNEWRDERREAARAEPPSRTVRVKGHEVMVTYKRRPVMRANPRPGGNTSGR